MAEIERLLFKSANGTVRALDNVSGQGIFALWGISGRFMPSFQFDTQPLGGIEGVEIIGVEVQPRLVTVPIRIEGVSRSALRDLLRSVSLEWSPDDRDGQLLAIDFDGFYYTLNCRYSKGMELSEESEYGALGANAAIEFFAADPYWYGSNPFGDSASAVIPGTPFLSDPFFPVEFAASQVLDNFSLYNPGMPTWPIITATGPFDDLSVELKSTGETIWIDSPVDAGHFLVIDTRPKIKTILLNGNVSIYSSRRVGSKMFALRRGLNLLRIVQTGADIGTSIAVSATPRYWAP